MFDVAGKFLREVKFPGLGTVGGFRRQAEGPRNVLQLRLVHRARRPSIATTSPAARARYFARRSSPSIPTITRPSRSSIASKDGTKIPMFISYKKGLKRDGQAPTYLFGYGGFNIPLTPSFSPANLVWMEMGGVFAHAQPARRRRIRRGVAQGRHEAEEAERVRRLHRRGRVADRRTSTRRRPSWRSAAAPTAGCWSARA